jgi:Flp pilus assembly pilin Flp
MRAIRSFMYSQGGQTTTEYALVLLVAGLVVGVFAAFVKGGSLAEMFHHIIDRLIARAEG